MVFETDGAIVMYGRKDKGLWEFGGRKKERPWESRVDNIKMGLTQIICEVINCVYIGDYKGQLAGSCEHGDVPSYFKRCCNFLDQLKNC